MSAHLHVLSVSSAKVSDISVVYRVVSASFQPCSGDVVLPI